MDLNPQKIAMALIHQHGLEKARKEVLAIVMRAQQQDDNYSLSVWRDVKRILGERARGPAIKRKDGLGGP